MERYITFIRDTQTGEEFISTRRDIAGNHKKVIRAELGRYPHPNYRVHTSYTEKELKDILETLNRWTGDVATADIDLPSEDVSFKPTTGLSS